MLRGKTAIITGASSGIGRALGLLLAREGMKVVLAARREEKLMQLASEIKAAGGTAMAVRCDVSDRRQAEYLVEETVATFGRVNVLINNAGRGHFSSVEDTTDEMILSMFSLNTFALWYTTRPTLRRMKEAGEGHIINVASMAGKVGYPYNSAYVAAKHACVGFTHALRLELAGTGIHASVVCPGAVLTDWANVTEGAPMLPFFSASGPIAKRIAAERNISLPAVEGVIRPERVARSILECILNPIPEVYTNKGTREFALLAAERREDAENSQLPIVLAEREIYEGRKSPDG